MSQLISRSMMNSFDKFYCEEILKIEFSSAYSVHF